MNSSHHKNQNSEGYPLLSSRSKQSSTSFSSLARKSSFASTKTNSKVHNEEDARKVLLMRGVNFEADAAVYKKLLKEAHIHGIFFPFDNFYKMWWNLTVVGAIATGFFLPYEIAFQDDRGTLNNIADIVAVFFQIIFCVDLAVNFNLAYYSQEGQRLVFQRKEIAKHYLSCMFWVDLFGVLPLETIALWMTGNLGAPKDDVIFYFLLRLPRLVRLHRLKKFNNVLQYDGQISFLWFTLLRNFAAVLVVAHWEACTMYFVARIHNFDEDTWLGPLVAAAREDPEDGRSTFELYLTSLYLSVVTFCTVGYGDFSPVNNIEKLVGSFFMLLNIVVAAWIVGSVTLLIVKGDEKSGGYRDNLDALQQYGRLHDFDDEFMDMLKSQLQLGFQNEEISDEQVLKPFPSAVRRKLLRKLYLQPLLHSQLMKGVRQQFVDAFLASCKVEIFSPGEEIVERGAILSDLFLLVGGVAEVTNNGYADVEQGFDSATDDGTSTNIQFEEGDFIGEIGFFTESPQVESVTCLTVCKTLTISQQNYRILENDHPGSAGKILKNLLTKVETLAVEIKLPENLTVLRAGSYFRKSNSASDENETVSSGYDLLGPLDSSVHPGVELDMKNEPLTAVRELIEMHMSKQLDDQTTRLLFASSRGDTATIALMCDQGFDANNSDYDNRTALHVASMKGNTEVVKLLLDFKADPNLADMHGSTALLEAVKNGHEDTMTLLQRHGASMNMPESHAASILCQAVFDGDSTLLRRLLEAGVPPNSADYDKRTASHIAAAEGNISAFRILHKNGADAAVVDRWGNTPQMEAERHQSKKILDFLDAQS